MMKRLFGIALGLVLLVGCASQDRNPPSAGGGGNTLDAVGGSDAAAVEQKLDRDAQAQSQGKQRPQGRREDRLGNRVVDQPTVSRPRR